MIHSIMAHSRLKCPNCDDDFGQEARFLDHLTDVHGVSDHLSLYLQINHDGVQPTCGCSETCQEKLPWAGWKKGFVSRFARGHNAKVDSTFLNKERQAEIAKKRIDGFHSGRLKSWNLGLTKETDERIKLSAEKTSVTLKSGYESGSIASWQSLDPERAKLANQKQSATKATRYAAGELKVWNLGKTKETDELVASIAKKISARYKLPDAGHRIKLADLQQRIKKHESKFTLLSNLDEYVTRRVQRLRFQCVTCQREVTKSLAMLEETPVCFVCHPKESKGQLELFDFVKTLALDAVLSDRTILQGLELDVFVPSRRFGIEYDGLYYHSEEFASNDRAAKKMRKADENNVAVLRIFEDEWRDKRLIVEAMIKHRLGLATHRIGARQCKLKELTSSERRVFMDACHLDGDVRSKAAWGLVSDGQIIAALSVRRPFHKMHKNALEVARFCLKPGISAPGALARLAKHALQRSKEMGYDRLMTYVDRRVGKGEGYVAAGFKVVRTTKPRFWWTDYKHRYDRFSVRADAKNGITQEQAAEAAGVVRVWGCPNVLLEMS